MNLTKQEQTILNKAFAILDREVERGVSLSDPEIAGRMFQRRLRESVDREVLTAMFLDNRHRLIAQEDLFMGGLDGAEVHPRVIVKRALEHNAGAVILGHNHPSGHPEPSAADRAVTARLKQALALIDVRLLDHFIIGDGKPVSMAARGMV